MLDFIEEHILWIGAQPELKVVVGFGRGKGWGSMWVRRNPSIQIGFVIRRWSGFLKQNLEFTGIYWQVHVVFNNWSFTKEVSSSVKESWELQLPWTWDCRNLTPWSTGRKRHPSKTSELKGKLKSPLPTWVFSFFPSFFHNLLSSSFFNLCIFVKHPIYCVPNVCRTVVDTGDRAVNKRQTSLLCLPKVTFQ